MSDMKKETVNSEFRKIISAIDENAEDLSPEEKLDLRLTASFCLWVEEMQLEYGVIPDLSFIRGRLLAKGIDVNGSNNGVNADKNRAL
jgi:hypothetical protein